MSYAASQADVACFDAAPPPGPVRSAPLVHAPGWQPDELGFGRAVLIACVMLLSLATLFVGAGGPTWLRAAWVQPAAVAWTGPSLISLQ